MNARLCTLTFFLLVLVAYQAVAWRKKRKTGGYDLFHLGVAALGVTASLRILYFGAEMAITESGKLANIGLIGIGEDDYLFVVIGGLSLGKLSIAQLRDHFLALLAPPEELSGSPTTITHPSQTFGTSVLPAQLPPQLPPE